MRLTKEQIEARISMYNEGIDHMEMEIFDDEVEREQALFIQRQLIQLRDKFVAKHFRSNV